MHRKHFYDRFVFRNKMLTLIKGRVGKAWHWNERELLPYATAGISFANVGLTYKNDYVDDGNAINLNVQNVYGLLDPNGQGHVNLSASNVVVALNYWMQ